MTTAGCECVCKVGKKVERIISVSLNAGFIFSQICSTLVRYRQFTRMLMLNILMAFKAGHSQGTRHEVTHLQCTNKGSIILHICWTWLVQKSTSVGFPDNNSDSDLFVSGLKVVFVDGGVDVAFRGEVVQGGVHLLLRHLRPHLIRTVQHFVVKGKKQYASRYSIRTSQQTENLTQTIIREHLP